jgi:hypothetical protein
LAKSKYNRAKQGIDSVELTNFPHVFGRYTPYEIRDLTHGRRRSASLTREITEKRASERM